MALTGPVYYAVTQVHVNECVPSLQSFISDGSLMTTSHKYIFAHPDESKNLQPAVSQNQMSWNSLWQGFFGIENNKTKQKYMAIHFLIHP